LHPKNFANKKVGKSEIIPIENSWMMILGLYFRMWGKTFRNKWLSFFPYWKHDIGYAYFESAFGISFLQLECRS
jgi:hypothetical protein